MKRVGFPHSLVPNALVLLLWRNMNIPWALQIIRAVSVLTLNKIDHYTLLFYKKTVILPEPRFS